jgi:hypothetical protein
MYGGCESDPRDGWRPGFVAVASKPSATGGGPSRRPHQLTCAITQSMAGLLLPVG